jgi:hypothetical protein
MTLLLLIFHIIVHTFIHSITSIQFIHPSPFVEVPLYLLVVLGLSGKNFPLVPSLELNSGLLTVSYSQPTHYQPSYAVLLLSFAAP